MFKANPSFALLSDNYLFSEIARRIEAFTATRPETRLIRMGIGDVTRPLPPAAVEALHRAADDLGSSERFHGYGPEQGYLFLREKIAEHDFRRRGAEIAPDEIFISDGAKCDTGNIGDLFAPGTRVAVADPAYPVYVDSNVMGGRSALIDYLPCRAERGFLPDLPEGEAPDVVYLCYPNNPTGVAMPRREMKRWVDYALENGVLLLFDSAYEAYIRRDSDLPHTIYEIEGARRCAIEFRSFSKTAGFTGLRCGYTVVPSDLRFPGSEGKDADIRQMWLRRQTTKFNGASYLSQRAAEALYSPEGLRQTADTITAYMANAAMLRETLRLAGATFFGGLDSPYIWLKTPGDTGSWEFFDILLKEANVVVTPGSGFGSEGEGYVRLTAFNTAEATAEACRRLKPIFKKDISEASASPKQDSGASAPSTLK